MADDSLTKRQLSNRRSYEKNKAKVRARSKAWAEAHPEEMREMARKSQEKNRDRRKAELKLRRDTDPEFRKRTRQYSAKYRAKKRAANPPPSKPTPLERFNLSYDVDAASGCWLWTGTLNRKGYATMKIHQKTIFMHRWAFEHFKEPIPDGFECDHTCHNPDITCPGGNGCKHRRCVNPDHLEATPKLENTKRGKKHYWDAANITRPTHCPQGHPYVDPNVIYSGKDGRYRTCRTCKNIKQLQDYYARRKRPSL